MEFLKGLWDTLPAWAQHRRLQDIGRDDNERLPLASITAPENPQEEFLKLARTNPDKFINRWVDLYEADKSKEWKERGGRAAQPALTNPHLFVMTRVLASIAEDVLHSVRLFGEYREGDVQLERLKHWIALFEARLPGYCAQMACDIHFLREAPSWVLDMMKIFDAVVSYSTFHVSYLSRKPGPLNLVAAQLAATVCESCRLHQDVLEDGSLRDQVTSGMAKEMRVSLRSIMSSDQILRRRGGVPSSDVVYAPDLLLTCWFRQDSPWNYDLELLNVMAFSPAMEQPERLASLLESEVIVKYGAEAYLARLSAALQDPHMGDGPLSSLISIQRKVLLNKSFNPHFTSTGTTSALCAILERENDREDPCVQAHYTIVISTLNILKWIVNELPVDEGAAVLIRHYDIFRLLSRCMQTLSKTVSTAEMGALFELCESFERVGQSLAPRPRKDALRKDYKRAFRQEWVPLLDILDGMLSPGLPTLKGADIIDLSRRIWKKTGCVGADFSEADARRWYETRKGKFCLWEECRWHSIEPPNPTKRCTGCRQARYCSRLCQSRDWKSGHRLSCCALR